MSDYFIYLAKLLLQFAKSEKLNQVTSSSVKASELRRRLMSASRYISQQTDAIYVQNVLLSVFQMIRQSVNSEDYYAFLVWLESSVGLWVSYSIVSQKDRASYQLITDVIQREKGNAKNQLLERQINPETIQKWNDKDLRADFFIQEKASSSIKQYNNHSSNILTATKDYVRPQSSYSGADMVCTINVPGKGPIVFGELSSISYSIYREKVPVRALGRISMKGYTRGMRTISGVLTFTIFDESVVYRCMQELREQGYRILMDEMPLFDVTITMANEFGSKSMLTIYGVTTYTEGKVMSVDEIMTQNVYEFYALDINPLTRLPHPSNVI
jgi:hypothetical protein